MSLATLPPSGLDRLPACAQGPIPRARARMRRLMMRAAMTAREAGPVVRRALDVVLAGSGLLALSPLLVGTALAIKVSSKGPVFYAQTRVGQGGRTFRMFKFRSMFTGADAQKKALAAANAGALDGVRFKMRKDPRITPVGRIIRKLSIDELPQLLNVVLGDMTVVGPRPPVPSEVALYDPRALRRLEVRPGLTCIWQISGRSDLSFDEQVKLDLHFIDRVSPTQEIAIVAKTIPAVVTGRGAY